MSTVDELFAEYDAWEKRHAARPWIARRPLDAWWRLKRSARELWHVPPWRRLKWRWQRAMRGWSDRDVWNLDSYLAAVISGSVAQLREEVHGYPAEMTFDDWKDVLDRISGPLAVDWDRIVDGETPQEGLAREKWEAAAQVAALHLFAEHFHGLWD
jgi:hypothetical protein